MKFTLVSDVNGVDRWFDKSSCREFPYNPIDMNGLKLSRRDMTNVIEKLLHTDNNKWILETTRPGESPTYEQMEARDASIWLKINGYEDELKEFSLENILNEAKL